jgi:lipopolysaccharide biosynthesis glycosyltransferase
LYEHKYPFRVYSWDILDDDKISHLKEIGVEVISLKREDYSHSIYYSQYGFKWKGLLESDCDIEILLDCDTIFLDNLDDLIDLMKDYQLVVVPEFINQKSRVGNFFNIGLMGFKKESKYLLEKSIQRMIEQPWRNSNNTAPNTEMFSLCDIVQEDNINVLELPWEQYMHLWWNHSLKKTLEIQDGKFVVKNEDGSRVRFYHYTTHIDPFKESSVLRFAYDYETTNRMWLKRFNNPMGLIYNHLKINETFKTILETQEEWKIR